MEEYNQDPYYSNSERQRYLSFPPESAEVHARSNQNIELQFRHNQPLQFHHDQLQQHHNQLQSQYNQLQVQHNELQLQYSQLQLHLNRCQHAPEHTSPAWNQGPAACLIKDNEEHIARAKRDALFAFHLCRTRISQRIAAVVNEEPIDDDDFRLTPDHEDSPIPAGFSGEKMEDEDDEPAPAPVAPTTVASHELRYSKKKDRDEKMSIYHRKESAHCEVAMTQEEYFQIKGLNHVAPQTFSMPGKNGKFQEYKRIQTTRAERDQLNANGRKPHELRKDAKYSARDYQRLNPPLTIKPRKTIEWSKAKGDVPAP